MDEGMINLNTADEAALQSLPGVGKRMAEKIVDSRPYNQMEDLLRVRGISQAMLDRWAVLATVGEIQAEGGIDIPESDTEELGESDAEILGMIDEVEEDIVEEASAEFLDQEEEMLVESPIDELVDGEPEDSLEELAELPVEDAIIADLEPFSEAESILIEDEFTEPEMADELIEEVKLDEKKEDQPSTTKQTKAADRPPVKSVTRGQLFVALIIASFVTFLLAVGVSIAVLAANNEGELRYASPRDVRALETKLGNLESELSVLNDDLTGIRTRLDNLELVGARMTAAEAHIVALQDDFAAAEETLSAVNDQVSLIAENVKTLSEQNSRYETFFQGLETLLRDVFQMEGQNE